MRSVRSMDADQGVAVTAFVEQGKVEFQRGSPVALGDGPAIRAEQRRQRRRQLVSEIVPVAIWGVEKDQIVLPPGTKRPHAKVQRVLAGYLSLDPERGEVATDRLQGGASRVDHSRLVGAT